MTPGALYGEALLMRSLGARETTPLAPGEPTRPQDAPLAPYPLIDKFPTVLGSNLTINYISSAFRLCQTGYRREYVDVLDELLEREPHGFAVLSQRILTVAGGRLEISPAVPENDGKDKMVGTPYRRVDGDSETRRAWEIRDFVDEAIGCLPDMQQALASLLWSLYYGVAAVETSWRRDHKNRLVPSRLHFIHSRRINYPDPASWRARIWDQGLVRDWHSSPGGGMYPTEQMFGIAVEDYPGKFILHTPQLRGDYPTRDGLGREIAYYFALKSMTMRGAGQYIERFGKPWAFAKYSTKPDGVPRAATQQDIEVADAAIRALGIGSIAGATIPDSVTVDVTGPGVKSSGRVLTHCQFTEMVNKEISKAVLGQTLTTESQATGGYALGAVHKEGSRELARYDAACLAQTLQQQLVAWMVRFNYPDAVHLTPRVRIVVDSPDPAALSELVSKASEHGAPVDADWYAEQVGIQLVSPDDKKARRMFPVKMIDPSALEGGGPVEPPPVPAAPKLPSGTNGVAKPGGPVGHSPAKPPAAAD